jgi:hypothetical protein
VEILYTQHHIGVNFQHQAQAASSVEKHAPHIIFDGWVGTTECRYEQQTEEKILKHRPRTFKGQSATPLIVGYFADCK